MNPPDREFQDLMQRVMAGDETAAQELFDKFGPYLVDLIRKRLAKRARVRFDSVDVAQDVWASFFARPIENRTFDSPEALFRFLSELARNKATDANRNATRTKKNDVRREQSMDDSRRFDKENLVGKERTPSQILMSTEEWAAFLRRQPKAYRKIFMMLREGKKQEQIALELDIHQKTVQRVLRVIGARIAS